MSKAPSLSSFPMAIFTWPRTPWQVKVVSSLKSPGYRRPSNDCLLGLGCMEEGVRAGQRDFGWLRSKGSIDSRGQGRWEWKVKDVGESWKTIIRKTRAYYLVPMGVKLSLYKFSYLFFSDLSCSSPSSIEFSHLGKKRWKQN